MLRYAPIDDPNTRDALAAVAVSSAAMAQVTISGVVDVQAVDTRKVTSIAKDATAVTTNNTAAPSNNGWGTSRLDFNASEDLGNGLKASAFWSLGLAGVGIGASDRDRSVSLSGGFGTVRAGYFTPASDGSGGVLVGLTTNAIGDSDGITNSAAHTIRRTAIQYTTPNMGGLTANVAWSNGKTADQSALNGKAGGSLTGLTLSYVSGPLSLGAGMSSTTTNVEAAAGTAGICVLGTASTGLNSATSTLAVAAGDKCTSTYTRISGADPVADSVTKSKQNYVGASYNLGVAVVGASYKTGKITAAGVNSLDARVTTFGVSVPMGAVTLGASMYTGKDAVAAAVTTDGIDHKGSQISARYALSKRTFAYVVQGRAETKRQATNVTTAVSKTTQTTAGLVHSF
jgi:predicted porin